MQVCVTASNGRFVVMHENPPSVALSVTAWAPSWRVAERDGGREEEEGLKKGLEGGRKKVT